MTGTSTLFPSFWFSKINSSHKSWQCAHSFVVVLFFIESAYDEWVCILVPVLPVSAYRGLIRFRYHYVVGADSVIYATGTYTVGAGDFG